MQDVGLFKQNVKSIAASSWKASVPQPTWAVKGFPLDFGISAIYVRVYASLKTLQVSTSSHCPTAIYCSPGPRFSPQSNVISPCKWEEFPWPMPDAPAALLD